VVELAQAGDVSCLRMLLDRLWPMRRGQPVHLNIPEIKSAADVPAVIAAIWTAVGDGLLTPDEASALVLLAARSMEAIQIHDILKRLEDPLERAAEKKYIVRCGRLRAIAYFLGGAKRPNEWFDGFARALGYPSWVAMSQPMAEALAKALARKVDAGPTEFYRRYVKAHRQLLLQQFGERGPLTTAALQEEALYKTIMRLPEDWITCIKAESTQLRAEGREDVWDLLLAHLKTGAL
jgi:hypothetical protein